MKIVVLNDGETYSDIRGCTIVEVSDDMDAEDIEAWLPEYIDGALNIEALLHIFNAIEELLEKPLV